MVNNHKPIIVILGPTASAKTRFARFLSEKISAEVVNCDLYQMYKDIKIATNKTDTTTFTNAKCHLFDFLNGNDDYSIRNFQEDGRKIINEILNNNKTPILVGGSVLYIMSLLQDYQFTNKRENFDKYLNMSKQERWDLLNKLDPIEAIKLHPNNERRVLRALEIFEKEKMSKTEFNSRQSKEMFFKNILFITLNPNRDELIQVINNRVVEQFNNGLKEEAIYILSKYIDSQVTSAIGIKEWKLGLNDSETIKLIQKHTRNYAKHQLTFIRKISNNNYFELDFNNIENTFKNIYEKCIKKYCC
ncbi:hypothetical protein ASO20_00495 [Mycoplasma sp. (ex Biomphalaria glabrata)]|uniref:tRNA (adenosine(37)-N6)-dimethylallyltransferase MiaA n=1 Tax=Mycoplasma sp. (ex Biomphalaria glabrata) TaxID=1749074 RepID=UPI00073AC293|nr:tRNA (adenosine(37)-N6)-dimethylallyltransferase MiaA [Mycoplasma sp. (ex Biomphalaria glabrata)]ALV23156.1 hypothetical protein ASO20_00495 [Mycoplasma sp. (ex Biomphalaria glabrata)]